MPIVDVTPTSVAALGGLSEFTTNVRKMALENTNERLAENADKRSRRITNSNLRDAAQLRLLRGSEEKRASEVHRQNIRASALQEADTKQLRRGTNEALRQAADGFLSVVPEPLRDDVADQVEKLNLIEDPRARQIAFAAIQENVAGATVELERRSLIDEITNGISQGHFLAHEAGQDGEPSGLDEENGQRLKLMLEGLEKGIADPDEIRNALSAMRGGISAVRRASLMREHANTLLDGAVNEARANGNMDALGDLADLQSAFMSGLLEPDKVAQRLIEIRSGARGPRSVQFGTREIKDTTGFSRPPGRNATISSMTTEQRAELEANVWEDSMKHVERLVKMLPDSSKAATLEEVQQLVGKDAALRFIKAANAYGWQTDAKTMDSYMKAIGPDPAEEQSAVPQTLDYDQAVGELDSKFGPDAITSKNGKPDITPDAFEYVLELSGQTGVDPGEIIARLYGMKFETAKPAPKPAMPQAPRPMGGL